MLNDVMGSIQKALFFGGAVLLVGFGIWTYLNLKDGGGGGAQLTVSIMGMVGGGGMMGLSALLSGLDTSFAG